MKRLHACAASLQAGRPLAFARSAPAIPATAEFDFTCNTVDFSIPFALSGRSAKSADFHAPLLGEALQGKPIVTVKFMPGAGSAKGANRFQKQKHEEGRPMFERAEADIGDQTPPASLKAVVPRVEGGIVRVPRPTRHADL